MTSTPHSIQDDFKRVRDALGPRTRQKNASYLERVRNETLDALKRIEEQLEEAEQAAQRNWDTHTDHVAEIIDSERKGMQALRDRIAELELTVSRIDAMVPDLERASPFQRKISEITQAVLYR